jgi:integrase
MATFKICVFKNQKRKDDKYPVSIRVCWKREYAYISTEYYVTEKQINKKTFALKDVFIINELNKRIAKYEDAKVQKLGSKIEIYTARELAEYLKNETRPGSDASINFISFARNRIAWLKEQGRETTAGNMNRTVNAIVDFCNGREKIAITEITYKFLEQFEQYLRGTRVLKRKNQFGRLVTTKNSGLSDVSIYDYMNDIRVLFNAAMDEYNDEDKDEVRILHYPFRKYKLKPRPENEKRNISKGKIIKIRDAKDEVLVFDRAILARDIFMLSFYLVGMNMADLFSIKKYQNGRLEYERMKTKGRRSDRAFISIKVEDEAKAIIEKYKDPAGKYVFNFHMRYGNSRNFNKAVNIGLKIVSVACNIDEEDLSTYYARHSWATIARNKCDVSKDDVDLALNHIDQGLKMADAYIEKDWSRIDTANRAVLDFIKI